MSFEEEVAIKHAKAVAEMDRPSKKELSKQEIYENFITNKNNKNNEKLKTFAEQLDKNYFMLKNGILTLKENNFTKKQVAEIYDILAKMFRNFQHNQIAYTRLKKLLTEKLEDFLSIQTQKD